MDKRISCHNKINERNGKKNSLIYDFINREIGDAVKVNE